MTTQLVKQEFSLLPTTFAEAEKYATMIARSSFCPQGFKGNPGDVLIAVQMGNELGLKPIQALQNIAVINGKPSIYGDAMLALVKNHPDYEWMKEEGDEKAAVCTIKRRNEPERVVTFTRNDAEIAGLWGKAGPWKTYPKRMLQMRARGFACRDAFPDALKGLISEDEARDYVITPNPNEKYMGYVVADAQDDLKVVAHTKEFLKCEKDIQKASSIEELEKIGAICARLVEDEKNLMRKIYAEKKNQLENLDNQDKELDSAMKTETVTTKPVDDEWTQEFDAAQNLTEKGAS